MTRLGSLARLSFLFASLMAASMLRAQDLQVIELHHRLADEIIPVVMPLLEPGGVLTGADNQLLVRTSPDNFVQIQAAVAAVDRALRQLRITVGQGTVSNVEAAGVRGGATIGDGDVQVGVNRPPGSSPGAEVQAGARSGDANLRNVSSVQALEGSETFISLGQSVPIRSTEVLPGRHGAVIHQSATYEDVASGFFATARVSGDQVVLDISSEQQRYRADRGGVIDRKGMTSTVTGRLGEWLELGAVREKSADSAGGILAWGRRTGNSEYSAWVRVEAIP